MMKRALNRRVEGKDAWWLPSAIGVQPQGSLLAAREGYMWRRRAAIGVR